MNVFPELLPPNVIARAANLSSTLLSDGMKELGIANYGCMEPEIAPVDKSMHLIGTAFTVDTSNGDNYPIHMATYSAPAEGYVMVIDGKGYSGCAYIGGLICGALQAVGYKGVVVDGYVRDRLDLIGMNFPTFARGLIPAGPIKKYPGAYNTAISCGGINVHPGDLVVGDADGVVVVPRTRLDEVFVKAEAKLAYEQKQTKKITAYKEKKSKGEILPPLAPEWVLDLLKINK